MELNSKIYVAGHKGLVGSSIVRKLESLGYSNIITLDKKFLDLRNQSQVTDFFSVAKPEYVFLAAAKVGGINYNKAFPADFLLDNLKIQNNVIESSLKHDVKKLMFLGSSCIYPKTAHQPMKEEYLLNGPLEPTNEGYAIAKIAGLKMCQMFASQYGLNAISAMPTNIYGINDNFDLERCHVIPAMIRRFHQAKLNNNDVTLFGSGTPMREFLYVDDLSDSLIYLMNNYDSPDHINIGSGIEHSIEELADMVAEITGFIGDIIWDTSKPDGNLRKMVDSSKLNNLGWSPSVKLEDGLKITYDWFLNNV
jgi:GDP-L-fucose synthase